jgi:phospholipase/carboxylesterase
VHVRLIVCAVLLISQAACEGPLDLDARPEPPEVQVTDPTEPDDGLVASPHRGTRTEAPTGLLQWPAAGEGSLLYVPGSYRPRRPMPFALTLHGCCSEARGGLNLWFRYARRRGIILMAPDGGGSWGDPGEIDAGLQEAFKRYAVHPDHVAVVGFSAGASYALSLGLGNGDLFTHVVAHSPGGYSESGTRGQPEVFVAHGTDDRTLPVQISRQLVPDLRHQGYDVRYLEFPAGHRPQPDVMRKTVRWFLN